MATPHVAGVAALAASLSSLPGTELQQIMKQEAQAIGTTDDPNNEMRYGAGLVRADNVAKYLTPSRAFQWSAP